MAPGQTSSRCNSATHKIYNTDKAVQKKPTTKRAARRVALAWSKLRWSAALLQSLRKHLDRNLVQQCSPQQIQYSQTCAKEDNREARSETGGPHLVKAALQCRTVAEREGEPDRQCVQCCDPQYMQYRWICAQMYTPTKRAVRLKGRRAQGAHLIEGALQCCAVAEPEEAPGWTQIRGGAVCQCVVVNGCLSSNCANVLL